MTELTIHRKVGERMKKDFIVRRSITMVEGKPHVETYSEQELVRCKDCKHYLAKGILSFCNLHGIFRVGCDCCYDGVKRE